MTRELWRSTNQRQKQMRWSVLTICFKRKGTKPILQATIILITPKLPPTIHARDYLEIAIDLVGLIKCVKLFSNRD
jgi:hypothetical protein